MRNPSKLTVLGWIAVLLLGAGGLVLGQARQSEVETRIVARPQADGDVEVALMAGRS